MRSGLAVYDKHVAFWGSAFSNFYDCEFVENGKTWKSSEQCFMAKKAEYFGDNEMYDAIVAAKTPAKAKSYGRKVRFFDADEWSKVCFDKMYETVYAKFSQNEDLRDFILSDEFDGKDFVEGSPFDAIWGVKMDWRNPDIDNEENWKGQNLLGKVLNRVREDLKSC
jgi:ribA/ribD-fused uncharacterized protein